MKWFLTLMTFVSFSFSAWGKPPVMIVHKENTVKKLSPMMVYGIYTRIIQEFPNGQPIHIYLLPQDDFTTTAFFISVVPLSLDLLETLYIEQEVSGRSSFTPTLVDDNEAMLERLREDPTGLGYLNTLFLDSSVNTLSLKH